MLKAVLFIALFCACEAYSFQRRSNECEYKGKKYSVGTFYDANNNKCTCSADGGISCVGAPLSNVGCTFKGESKAVGKFQDGCHPCECKKDGSIACSGCALKNGREVTCDFNGRKVKVGDFMDNKMGRCTCNEEGEVGCVGFGTHADKNCESGGKSHPSRTMWIEGEVGSSDCAVCVCHNGLIGCTPCEGVSYGKDYPEDSAEGCTYKGQDYMHGQMFKEGCKTCSCDSGEVECDKSSCPRDFKRELIELLKQRLM